MLLERKPSRMKISRMSVFGRVHRPNFWRWNTLQIMLLYVTEVNACLLSRTIYTPMKSFMCSRFQISFTDTKHSSIGLRLILPGQSCPVFISLPRSKSLGIMSNGKNICAAMRSYAQTQPQSQSRGRQNHIFTDHDNKYYSVGTQPGVERRVQIGFIQNETGFSKPSLGLHTQSVKTCRICIRHVHGQWSNSTYHANKATCEVSNDGTISFFVTDVSRLERYRTNVLLACLNKVRC